MQDFILLTIIIKRNDPYNAEHTAFHELNDEEYHHFKAAAAEHGRLSSGCLEAADQLQRADRSGTASI